MQGIQARLEAMLEPTVSALGCALWGVEYIAHGKRPILRVYIDKPSGVSIEDCEAVSRQIAGVLDVEDPISGEYTLEVSSPGMDRRLYRIEQYQDFLGQKVAVKLRVSFEGRRKFTGVLKGIENEEVILECDNEEYILPYELIDKANVVPTF